MGTLVSANLRTLFNAKYKVHDSETDSLTDKEIEVILTLSEIELEGSSYGARIVAEQYDVEVKASDGEFAVSSVIVTSDASYDISRQIEKLCEFAGSKPIEQSFAYDVSAGLSQLS